MANLAKKDRVGLGEWLESIKSNPTTAPSTLRPFFEQQTEQVTEQQTEQVTQQVTQQVQAPITPPPSNKGVQQPSSASTGDLLSRATDPTFYAQNRDAIRQAFYSRLGQTPNKF